MKLIVAVLISLFLVLPGPGLAYDPSDGGKIDYARVVKAIPGSFGNTKGYFYVARYQGFEVSGFTKRKNLTPGQLIRVRVVMSITPAEE